MVSIAGSLRRWVQRPRPGYPGGVGIAWREDIVAPLPRPSNLEQYVGMWVAVIDGEVVAAETTSRALAYRLHQMDHVKRRRAVMEYVRPASAAYIIGAG